MAYDEEAPEHLTANYLIASRCFYVNSKSVKLFAVITDYGHHQPRYDDDGMTCLQPKPHHWTVPFLRGILPSSF
jgi:hypothetical protein